MSFWNLIFKIVFFLCWQIKPHSKCKYSVTVFYCSFFSSRAVLSIKTYRRISMFWFVYCLCAYVKSWRQKNRCLHASYLKFSRERGSVPNYHQVDWWPGQEPNSSYAVNCADHSSEASRLKFYYILSGKDPQKQKLWLDAI